MPKEIIPPLKTHGGKYYLAPKFIALMPPHKNYVTTHAGGLGVLLQKDFDEVAEIVNDVNRHLTNFWDVLKDPSMFEMFCRHMEATPFSQAEWERSQYELYVMEQTVQQLITPLNPWNSHRELSPEVRAEWASHFMTSVRQSRQGLQKCFATISKGRRRRGMNEQVSAWLNAVDGLPIAHDRLSRVLIMIGDALDCIKKTDHVDTLFYCDPPYLPETRSSPGSYGPHEMTPEQHQDLLDLLATIEGKFMLSGYPSEMYAAMAKKHGWNSVEILIPNQASSKKVKDIKKEVVWMNYALELAT